jgi:hypothetical protein
MISETRLDEIFFDCLFTPEEMPSARDIPEGTILVEGVVAKFGLHPQRLASHRAEVAAMLAELPDSFHYHEGQSGGVGDSFLRACQDKGGELWTDQHRRVEQLVVLGLGLGMVLYLLPRGLWDLLPGGMPMLVVDTSGELMASVAAQAPAAEQG